MATKTVRPLSEQVKPIRGKETSPAETDAAKPAKHGRGNREYMTLHDRAASSPALKELKAIERDAIRLADRVERYLAEHPVGCGCHLCQYAQLRQPYINTPYSTRTHLITMMATLVFTSCHCHEDVPCERPMFSEVWDEVGISQADQRKIIAAWEADSAKRRSRLKE